MFLPDVEGSVTLTSSPRLASWILFRYGQKKRSSGCLTWSTPSVLPLFAWMKQLWSDSWPDRFILSHLQALRLWESILRDDSSNLLHFEEVARRVAHAFTLIQQYRIPLESKLFDWTHESSTFFKSIFSS